MCQHLLLLPVHFFSRKMSTRFSACLSHHSVYRTQTTFWKPLRALAMPQRIFSEQTDLATRLLSPFPKQAFFCCSRTMLPAGADVAAASSSVSQCAASSGPATSTGGGSTTGTARPDTHPVAVDLRGQPVTVMCVVNGVQPIVLSSLPCEPQIDPRALANELLFCAADGCPPVATSGRVDLQPASVADGSLWSAAFNYHLQVQVTWFTHSAIARHPPLAAFAHIETSSSASHSASGAQGGSHSAVEAPRRQPPSGAPPTTVPPAASGPRRKEATSASAARPTAVGSSPPASSSGGSSARQPAAAAFHATDVFWRGCLHLYFEAAALTAFPADAALARGEASSAGGEERVAPASSRDDNEALTVEGVVGRAVQTPVPSRRFPGHAVVSLDLGPLCQRKAVTSAVLLDVMPTFAVLDVAACLTPPVHPSEQLLVRHCKAILDYDEYGGSTPSSHLQNQVRELPFYCDVIGPIKATWADFIRAHAPAAWEMCRYEQPEIDLYQLQQSCRAKECRLVSPQFASQRMQGDIARDRVRRQSETELSELLVQRLRQRPYEQSELLREIGQERAFLATVTPNLTKIMNTFAQDPQQRYFVLRHRFHPIFIEPLRRTRPRHVPWCAADDGPAASWHGVSSTPPAPYAARDPLT